MSEFRPGAPPTAPPGSPAAAPPESNEPPIESLLEFTVAQSSGPAEVAAEFAMESVIEATAQAPTGPAGEVPGDSELASLLEPTVLADAEAAPEELFEPPPEAEVVPEPAPEAQPAQPIRCEFCGTEYAAQTSKFCDRCGRRFTRIMVVVPPEGAEFARCPKCGQRNRIGTRICVQCGNLIRESTI
jgi:hypothetical protein